MTNKREFLWDILPRGINSETITGYSQNETKNVTFVDT